MAVSLLRGRRLNDPDPKLVKDQLQWLQDAYNHYGRRFFVKQMLWILRKNPESDTKQILPSEQWNRRLVPFRFNRIQRDLDETLAERNICNKPRQAGYTTFFINVRLYVSAIIEPGSGNLLISQNGRYASAHFGILKRAHRYIGAVDPMSKEANTFHNQLLGNLLHTAYSNRKELVFDQLDSRVLIESAEVEEAGQGFCVHPDTPVIVASGRIIKYRELKKGSKVIGPDGLPVEVEKIYSIKDYSHPYKGSAFELFIHGMDLSTICAPNHPWLTQRGEIETKDLTGEDFIAFPKRKITSEIGSYDRNTGILCGLWMSRIKFTKNYVLVNDCSPAKRKYIQTKILPALQKIGDFKKLTKWLKNNFDNSKNAYNPLPDWIWQSGEDFIIGLIEGWIVGAGKWYRGSLVASTKNARWGTLARLLACSVGVGCPSLKLENKGVSLIFRKECHDWLFNKLNCYETKKYSKFEAEQIQDSKYVYVRVRKTVKTKCKEFLDITVKNDSHLYCLPIGLTHNTLNHVVATEVARWPRNPEETLANLKEAIAMGGTLDIESTPNGLGGYYYNEYMRAKRGWPNSEFRPHFHQWFWHDEYKIDNPSELLTFEDLNEEERKKQALFNLDMEQMTWRRKKMVSLRHNFREKYPEDDQSCFLTTGRQFFEQDILASRLAELQVYKPFDTLRNGEVNIFQKPLKGRDYIIGADPAEGKWASSSASTDVNAGSGDWSCAKIIDKETGEECASYRSRLAPEEFGADLVELGEQYNNALIAPERNNHGGTVILAIRELGYGNVYKHREWTKREKFRRGNSKNPNSAGYRDFTEFEGWPTTTKTRKLMLNKLGWFLRHHPEMIWDLSLIEEMLTFVYDETGKPAAQEGCHDDMVFASSLAHIVRWVTLGYIDVLTWRTTRYGAFEDEEEELENAI